MRQRTSHWTQTTKNHNFTLTLTPPSLQNETTNVVINIIVASSWWWTEWCPKHVEPIRSTIKYQVASRLFCILQSSQRCTVQQISLSLFVYYRLQSLKWKMLFNKNNRRTSLTFWRRNYFLILAHPVYKMWIIQEPNTLELWNKLHFEEKKSESIYHV